jgi:Uma2 family endonuclease
MPCHKVSEDLGLASLFHNSLLNLLMSGTHSDHHHYSTTVCRQAAVVEATSSESQGYVEIESSSPHKLSASKIKEVSDQIILLNASTWKTTPIIVETNVSTESFYEICEFLESRHRRARLALYKGDILFMEYPSSPHEAVIMCIAEVVGIYNDRVTHAYSTPILSLGSTTTQYGDRDVLETDLSFLNGFIPPRDRPKDARGANIPTFIIEIGYSETYASLCSTARTYLANDAVQMVISIKLIGSFQNNTHEVTGMICIIHEKDHENAIRITRVINFGARQNSIQAVTSATGYDNDQIEGVGFGYDGEYPFPRNHDTFSVVIPARVVWYGVAEEVLMNARHAHGADVEQDFVLDLRIVVDRISLL